MSYKLIALKISINLSLAVLLITTISGCVYWPRNEYSKTLSYSRAEVAVNRCTQSQLYQQLIHKKIWLNRLRQQGARRCFPGRWESATLLACRIHTEIDTIHLDYAHHDLKELHTQLLQLQLSLRYINARNNCQQRNLPNRIPNLYRKGW